ncbi:Amiloride-sensitive sodium channel subunit beta [Dirofilaria immitis]
MRKILRRSILSSYREAAASSTYDIGSSGKSSRDSSTEILSTISTKQYYYNNSIASITIPYNINHSKRFPALALQNAQKKADEVAIEAVALKQRKHPNKESHPFIMTQPTDCSQNACLSQSSECWEWVIVALVMINSNYDYNIHIILNMGYTLISFPCYTILFTVYISLEKKDGFS